MFKIARNDVSYIQKTMILMSDCCFEIYSSFIDFPSGTSTIKHLFFFFFSCSPFFLILNISEFLTGYFTCYCRCKRDPLLLL